MSNIRLPVDNGDATDKSVHVIRGMSSTIPSRFIDSLRKVSWRTTEEERVFLYQQCVRSGCRSQTRLMHLIMSDFMKSGILVASQTEQGAQLLGPYAQTSIWGQIKPQTWPAPGGTLERFHAVPGDRAAFQKQHDQILAMEQTCSYLMQRNAALKQQNQDLVLQLTSLGFLMFPVQAFIDCRWWE